MSFAAEIDKSVAKLSEITGCDMIITSGFRSKKDNDRVGGAKHSFHLTDRARDLVPKDRSCISIKELGKIACGFTSTLIYKKHLHIDNRKKKLCLKMD